METKPLIVERTYNAPIARVWKALTDRDQMKEWYFELSEFKAEKGFKFSFTGGDDHVQYVHHCEVLEVNPPNKLRHTWTYEKNTGHSIVTWELFREAENTTRVRLTHEGLESFANGDPNFEVASFNGGWNSILGESLRNFVETDLIKKSVLISASAAAVWQIILNPDHTYGKAFGGGALAKTDWKQGSEVLWTDSEGNPGAKGLVIKHDENHYLQVDMYDDIDAKPGSRTGEYSEKISLEKSTDGGLLLNVEAGPLARKYLPTHSAMWDEAVKIVKTLAEK